MQGAAEDPGACRLHLLLEDADPLHELPHLLLGDRVACLALNAVDGQQVVRHCGRCPCPAIPRGAYVSSEGRPHCSNSQGSGKPTIAAIRSPSICSTISP